MRIYTLLSIFLFISCNQSQKKAIEKEQSIDFIYEATYLDDFKMGNPELVLKVQEMHKYIIKKDYETASSYLADNVVFAFCSNSSV